MTRFWVLLLAVGALLLWACEPTALPSPEILSVEPAEVEASTGAELRIQFEALLPASLDYGGQRVESAISEVRVRIAGRDVPIERIEKDGFLVVRVPTELAPGTYAVELLLSDGREATHTAGFTVTRKKDSQGPASPFLGDAGSPHPDRGDGGPTDPPGDLDGGPAPDAGEDLDGGAPVQPGITGFVFHSIGAQVRDESFPIVIRALGPDARDFQGTVALSTSKGTIAPDTAGPFENGVVEVRVTISLPNPGVGVVITATGAQRASGSSNEFLVRPR
jgi:hypothetical protein